MSARCPYLRSKDRRDQVLLEPNLDHRCFVRYRAERVGVLYQAQSCLTPDHRNCPRLVATLEQGDRPMDRAPLPRPVASIPAARRKVTGTELAVLGMGVSLVLASLFVVVAIVLRFGTGPGMAPAPTVASGPVASTVTPTLTATPDPTDAAPTPILGPAVRVAPVYSPTPTPEPTVPTPTPYVRVPAASPPTRLVIPNIELDIPVLSVGIKTVREGSKPKVVWGDVPNAGGFHQTSAYPGNVGNTVINGHRDIQGSVFRHLDGVHVGDEIVLYVGDTPYPYLATEILIVPAVFASAEQRAENLRIIGTMPEERLTLITCTPVGLATHRLVVIAQPSAPTFPQMPQAGSDASP